MENDNTSYETIIGRGEAVLTEKKSRFIATIAHVESEAEANALLAEIRKKNWDARHNCYAYILGKKSETERFSDDGEPSGTAGRPILDILKGNRLTDTIIVVTRYFGGVLLGTGGLVRAYSQSSTMAVESAGESGKLATMRLMRLMNITTDYNLSEKVRYVFTSGEVNITDTRYEENVTFTVAIPVEDADGLMDKITDVTGGRAKTEQGDVCYYPVIKH